MILMGVSRENSGWDEPEQRRRVGGMTEREGQRFDSPLEGEHGSTRIGDGVVSKIAGMAAGEVEGVYMGGGASRTAGGVLESVTGSDSQKRGVSVEVGRTEAAIDLTMGIEYGRNILDLVGQVRNRITQRVESLTGLRITELNVTVSDIIFQEGESDGQEERRRREPESPAASGGGPLAEDETTELRLEQEETRRTRRRER
jgi:uncharacterized alkaline shock family protein YloU